ncbi:MAG: phage tail protein, partial [Thermoplasmatota archaeon]
KTIILEWEIEEANLHMEAWIDSPSEEKWRDVDWCEENKTYKGSIDITAEDEQYIGKWKLVSPAGVTVPTREVEVQIYEEGEPDAEVRLGEKDQSAHSINELKQTFPYTAYVSFDIDERDFQLIDGPTVTSEVEGRLVEAWDSENEEWVEEYSDNPAYCLLDLITNNRYGMGLSKDNIDLESFKDAAEYCDEVIPIGGPNISDIEEKRFQLDTVLDKQQSAKDQINSIMKTFRAHLVPREGKLALKLDAPDEPVQDFTEDNIVEGSLGYSKLSKKEKPNKIIVEYIDPGNNWDRNTVESTHQGNIKKTGEVREKKLQLYGIKRRTQAKREADFFKRQIWYCDTFTEFRAGVDSIHCQPGDVVTVTHSLPGWEEKKFRIIDIKESQNEEMTITAQEYNESIYSDTDVEFDYPQKPDLPNPNDPPPSVENLSLVEGNKKPGDGTWIPRIEISWDKPDNLFWERAIIYISDDDGANWEKIKKVEGTETKVEVDPATYKVRVQSENRLGIKEDFGEANTAQITIHGKEDPPSDVIFGDCEFDEMITLRWQAINDDDLKAYEVRTDENWGDDDDGLVYRGNALKTDYKPNERQYTFFIKALDRSGNYSEEADEITLNNPAPSAPNFSEDDITEFFETIKIHVPSVSEATGYKVYITPSDGDKNEDGDTEVIPLSTAQTINYDLNSGDSILIKIGSYDNLTSKLDDENVSDEYEATAATIDNIAQFAADLRPPKIVNEKPELPDSQYPEGSTVVLNDSDSDDHGKLFRNVDDEWTTAVEANDLSGQITETQIEDDSISTPKLQAASIIADKLASDSVTTDKIVANAITSALIEAGAIGADEIAAGEIIAEHIGSNEIITETANIKDAIIDDAKILNVSADKIKSGEVLANLLVSRGSFIIEGHEKEDVKSLTMMGMGPRDDQEITNTYDAIIGDSDGLRGYDPNGNKQFDIGNQTGDAYFDGILEYGSVIDKSVADQNLPEPTIKSYSGIFEGIEIELEM